MIISRIEIIVPEFRWVFLFLALWFSFEESSVSLSEKQTSQNVITKILNTILENSKKSSHSVVQYSHKKARQFLLLLLSLFPSLIVGNQNSNLCKKILYWKLIILSLSNKYMAMSIPKKQMIDLLKFLQQYLSHIPLFVKCQEMNQEVNIRILKFFASPGSGVSSRPNR